MISTTTEIWDDIIQNDPKLRRYEKKSFPLFEPLDLLYEGQLAEGKYLFTSSKPQSTSKGHGNRGTEKAHIDFSKKNPWTTPINVLARPNASDGEGLDSPVRHGESHGWANESTETHELDKQSSHLQVDKENVQPKKRPSQVLTKKLGRPSDHGKPIDLSDNDEQEVEQDRSSRSGPSRERAKRRNDTKVVSWLEESMWQFVSLKRDQATTKEKAAAKGQEFSITRCLNALKDLADLSDDVKIHASEVFKDAMNREIFLGYEPRLRGIWLKKEVNKLSTTSGV